MIDLALVKAELKSVTLRAERRWEAEQWATNQFDTEPFDLLPELPAEAKKQARRLASMTPSIGPQIVAVKKFLTLGDLNWGGKSTEFDEAFKAQQPDRVADEMLEAALNSGILAGIVRRTPRKPKPDDDEDAPTMSEPFLEVLNGHVEPLYDAENPSRVAGIFQAWKPTDVREKGWRVRIYDFDTETMSEWRKLEEPYEVGKDPFDVVENAPMPRFEILRRGRGRLPLGDLELALPLIKSDWSSQIRGDRAEENTAFSQLVLSGGAEDATNDRSPANVILLETGGDAKYLTPGDLSQIHSHHDRKVERLRRFINLPGGVLSGSNISGEALREDNMHAIADAKHKAGAIGRVLTELAHDFAAELEIGEVEDLVVTVAINKEFEAATNVDRIVTLFEKGLLEHGAAVRAISAYVPSWEDEQIEAFITANAEIVPPEPGSTSTSEQPDL